MPTLFATLTSFINRYHLLTPGQTIIVGLSGGPDSVFLLHFLHALKQHYSLNLIAAHLDHQWRPKSATDEGFCKEQAQLYNIPFVSKSLAEISFSYKKNGSQEEHGRKARRFFLEQVAREHDATAIALAHHADDQQENFFIRLCRGASLAGLTGMKPREGIYIRPLLPLTKQNILAYLHEHQIPYVIDESNESDAYLRNRIRKILPALKRVDERFDQNFERTLQQLHETETFIKNLTYQEYQRICPQHQLDIAAFFAVSAFMQQQILMHWLCHHRVPFTPSQGLLEEITRFLQQPGNGKHHFYTQWTIQKNNGKAAVSLF